jgi:hypothetical protein
MMRVSEFSVTCQDRSELLITLDQYRRGSAECHLRFAISWFSSNRTGILLVVPENELHQQKIADSLGDSVAFAQKNEF